MLWQTDIAIYRAASMEIIKRKDLPDVTPPFPINIFTLQHLSVAICIMTWEKCVVLSFLSFSRRLNYLKEVGNRKEVERCGKADAKLTSSMNKCAECRSFTQWKEKVTATELSYIFIFINYQLQYHYNNHNNCIYECLAWQFPSELVQKLEDWRKSPYPDNMLGLLRFTRNVYQHQWVKVTSKWHVKNELTLNTKTHIFSLVPLATSAGRSKNCSQWHEVTVIFHSFIEETRFHWEIAKVRKYSQSLEHWGWSMFQWYWMFFMTDSWLWVQSPLPSL